LITFGGAARRIASCVSIPAGRHRRWLRRRDPLMQPMLAPVKLLSLRGET